MIVDRRFKVDAQAWKLTDGKLMELKFDERVFVFKPNGSPVIFKPERKTGVRNIKISYLLKWIQSNDFDVFTLDQFLKAYPRQRRNNRLNSYIVDLINKKIISQLGPEKFKVNRR